MKKTRKQILNTIRFLVATDGRITHEATRLYTENRISRKAFDEACSEGIAQFKRAQIMR